MRFWRRKSALLMVSVWALAVSCGMARLLRYTGTPGASANAPAQWPAEWSIRPASAGATLVVALQANCVCSRATIAELERVMARGGEGVHAFVLMQPATGAVQASQGELWQSAAEIPSVT